jgi:hypothetical protein
MTSADKVKTTTCSGYSFRKEQQDRSLFLLKKQHRLLYLIILVSRLHYIDSLCVKFVW